MAQAQSGMQTQSTLATQGQDNQAEMERLTLQQHFQELESQRNAQLKLRQIQAQERIAAQRNSQGPPRNG
jgi:hypothetical protein